jgi:hypothetical protein
LWDTASGNTWIPNPFRFYVSEGIGAFPECHPELYIYLDEIVGKYVDAACRNESGHCSDHGQGFQWKNDPEISGVTSWKNHLL